VKHIKQAKSGIFTYLNLINMFFLKLFSRFVIDQIWFFTEKRGFAILIFKGPTFTD
jgi:hypothetical protein